MVTAHSQLASGKPSGGGTAGLSIGWYVLAVAVRLRLGISQAVNNLRRLAAPPDQPDAATPRLKGGRSAGISDGNRDGNRQQPETAINS